MLSREKSPDRRYANGFSLSETRVKMDFALRSSARLGAGATTPIDPAQGECLERGGEVGAEPPLERVAGAAPWLAGDAAGATAAAPLRRVRHPLEIRPIRWASAGVLPPP